MPRPSVLLVEGNRQLWQLLALQLKQVGYTSLRAHNGQDAQRQWDEHSPSIDLLITESVLPDMSGGELARYVRRQAPGLPVVYTAAAVPEGWRKDAGQDPILAKPFTQRELLQQVSQSLQGL